MTCLFATVQERNNIKLYFLPVSITNDCVEHFPECCTLSRSLSWLANHLPLMHFSVEGQLEFLAVLFVPCRALIALFTSNMKRVNVELHIRSLRQ